jgi:rubredoxin
MWTGDFEVLAKLERGGTGWETAAITAMPSYMGCRVCSQPRNESSGQEADLLIVKDGRARQHRPPHNGACFSGWKQMQIDWLLPVCERFGTTPQSQKDTY